MAFGYNCLMGKCDFIPTGLPPNLPVWAVRDVSINPVALSRSPESHIYVYLYLYYIYIQFHLKIALFYCPNTYLLS